jgi:hypothetical protein
MRSRRACVLGVLFVIWSICAGTQASASLQTYSVFGAGTPFDVNKANDAENNLCWAASAANILAYTGWDGGFAGAGDIYSEYVSHWSNQYGRPDTAWEWWMNATDPTSASQVVNPMPPGWSGYYPADNAADYIQSQWDDAAILSSIDDFLHDGAGVSLRIETFNRDDVWQSAHFLTVWGFVFDDAETQGTNDYYRNLLVTDSDEPLAMADWGSDYGYNFGDGLQTYGLSFDNGDNAWYLRDYFDGVYDDYGYSIRLSDVVALSPQSVPEASSLAVWSVLSMVGVGYGWRRRRRN